MQLLINHDDMIDTRHHALAGKPPVAWGFAQTCRKEETRAYPIQTSATADVNPNAFASFYDLMEPAYGVDCRTMLEIEKANDRGDPMRDIVATIPA